MPVIQGCKYDLFVSYAHADNYEGPGGERDISRLYSSLRAVLCQRLGAGGKDLSIYFDAQARANQQLDHMLQAARDSAIFLAIGSPSWVASKYCPKELEAFHQARPNTADIFVAEHLPLRQGEEYPSPITEHVRFGFHRAMSAEVDTRIPLTPEDEPRMFRDRIHSLVEQIVERIIELRDDAALQPAPQVLVSETKRKASNGEKLAIIAEPTDDLEEEASQISAHLQQYDLPVIDVPDSYEGLDKMQQHFEAALTEASLLVQVVGPHVGKRPSHMPNGIARYQYDAALAAGVKVMQWRHPELDLESTQSGHRELLESQHVVCSTLSEFMSRVVAELEPEPEQEPADVKMQAGQFLFVDADEKDREAIDIVLDELESTGLLCMGPEPETTEAKARLLDLESNFTNCDALILLHGQSSSTWVKSQLVLFTKLSAKRSEKLKLMAICMGPPVPKEEIKFRLADTQVVDCGNNWDMSPVRELIENLTG